MEERKKAWLAAATAQLKLAARAMADALLSVQLAEDEGFAGETLELMDGIETLASKTRRGCGG